MPFLKLSLNSRKAGALILMVLWEYGVRLNLKRLPLYASRWDGWLSTLMTFFLSRISPNGTCQGVETSGVIDSTNTVAMSGSRPRLPQLPKKAYLRVAAKTRQAAATSKDSRKSSKVTISLLLRQWKKPSASSSNPAAGTDLKHPSE
jgi:hypothetical protein